MAWKLAQPVSVLTLTHGGDACHDDLQQWGNSASLEAGKANNIRTMPRRPSHIS
jgi:hypothetical protein